MAGYQQAVNGKCPKGYVHIIGPLCIEETVLKEAESTVPGADIDWDNLWKIITSAPQMPCEMALAALQTAASVFEELIAAPAQMSSFAKKLLDRPFSAAEKLSNSVLGVLDRIDNMLDQFLDGAYDSATRLRQACEEILSCPFLADTAIGQIAAEILDAIESGEDYLQFLPRLKRKLQSIVRSFLGDIENVGFEAINKAETALQDMVNGLNLEDKISQLRGLELCVEAVCDMALVAARLPRTVDDMLRDLGGILDPKTGRVKVAIDDQISDTQKALLNMARNMMIFRSTN